ncbi:MAG: helix-turn-helix domain-containing protein [Mucilaginibacter sp.]
MQIAFNGIVVLLVVIISQAVFASGLLVFSNKNKTSNRLLGVLIFAIALWLVDDFMRIAMIYRQKPNLYFLPIFYSFGFGPLIYFYVRSLVNANFHFRPVQLLHFVPVLLQALLYVSLTFCPYKAKQWYWENIHQHYTYRLEFDGTWVSLTIYLILSFRLLQQYQTWLVNNFSEVSKIKLNWLKIILASLIILCIQWFAEIILRDFYGVYFEYDYSVEILGIIALILGIAGWSQSNLSTIQYESEQKDIILRGQPNFELDPEIMRQIQDAMEVDKLYLNPTLTLVELGSALKLNARVVSRHINAGFKKSFNDFVNFYRVEEVKRRLKSSDLEKLTIMGVALESGFNSKTTFNRIFKDFTDMAPSEFIR